MFNINGSAIHTVIFDFDGTLAKLNIDFQIMRNAVMELIMAHEITEDNLHTRFVLERIDEAFEILNGRSKQTAENFLNKANFIIETMETDAAARGALFDFTKPLLQTLRISNISCGIITRNCAKAVTTVFPDISSFCPVLICRDDVNNVKPHPEHISLALSKLGCLAEHTLMIGDHPIDIETGRNAGTKTCGVLTGRCSKNVFLEAGADIILARAANILDIIQ